MAKIIQGFILLLLCISPCSSHAEGEPKPPPSGLGQSTQEAPPEVVYPANEDITEGVIEEIETLQPSKGQYERLKKLNMERERQGSSPYPTPPKPVTRTLFVNLDPGISPPILRLAQGQQTSIVFSDTAGNPWKIEKQSLNRTLFQDGYKDDVDSSKQSNVITLEALKPAAYGNVTVTLKGLATPVIFVLSSGQPEVDMRIDAQIPGHNPDAANKTMVSGMPAIDEDLGYFLDGVPPKEAERLKVTGLKDAEAWFYKDSLYVRAKADAQYPAYLSAARSTSGLSVYRYAQRHNSVTFTIGGQVVTAFIE